MIKREFAGMSNVHYIDFDKENTDGEVQQNENTVSHTVPLAETGNLQVSA